jgi:predicted amidohydrolase YtcJ
MAEKTADLVLLNGNIQTQDPACPEAEALAVGGGRLLALGANREIEALAAGNADVIDLAGRLVLPGFVDSHFHFYDWALARAGLQLDRLTSLDNLLAVLKERAATLPVGQWVLGLGFNECLWPENRIPTCRELDKVVPDHPVLLRRCDMHLAVANTRALKKAGIGIATRDPSGGMISRDNAGHPDGILRERAIDLINDILPDPHQTDVMAAMNRGISELHALGITGLHDFRLMDPRQGAKALAAWRQLAADEKLNLRTWVTISGDHLEEAIERGIRTGAGDDRLRIGHVKYFADGGMGARTAWLQEPYLDGGCGQPMMTISALEKAVEKASAAGLAVAVHAVGDRAAREVISIFERQVHRARQRSGSAVAPALAHRIEHIQMIRPDDLRRLGRLPVAACVQPPNLPLDMRMIDTALGPNGKYAYAFKSILDSGIPTCFSSDAPVCDPNPLLGIHAAVMRQLSDGQPSQGWYPEQRLTVHEAVTGYTSTPAFISGCGNILGILRPGYLADLVVLDQNILTISPNFIPEAKVILTVFDGKIVFRDGV